MSQLCIRLRDQDKQKLDELETKFGKNTTEVIRDLIQIGHDREALKDSLGEMKAALTSLSNHQKSMAADLAQIKQVVFQLGKASPFVSRQLSGNRWFDIM